VGQAASSRDLVWISVTLQVIEEACQAVASVAAP